MELEVLFYGPLILFALIGIVVGHYCNSRTLAVLSAVILVSVTLFEYEGFALMIANWDKFDLSIAWQVLVLWTHVPKALALLLPMWCAHIVRRTGLLAKMRYVE